MSKTNSIYILDPNGKFRLLDGVTLFDIIKFKNIPKSISETESESKCNEPIKHENIMCQNISMSENSDINIGDCPSNHFTSLKNYDGPDVYYGSNETFLSTTDDDTNIERILDINNKILDIYLRKPTQVNEPIQSTCISNEDIKEYIDDEIKNINKSICNMQHTILELQKTIDYLMEIKVAPIQIKPADTHDPTISTINTSGSKPLIAEVTLHANSYDSNKIKNCNTPNFHYARNTKISVCIGLLDGKGLFYSNNGVDWFPSNIRDGNFTEIDYIENIDVWIARSDKGLYYSYDGMKWNMVNL